MSDTQLNDSVTTSSLAASPGELLSSQREELGIPLSDAARALNLRPAVVIGLEQDNYDEIPVVAYRRGYLRAYAKYLGINDHIVLDAYQSRYGSADTESKVTPVSVTRPPSKVGAWLFKLVTLLVIVGLIVVTVMWWQSRGGNEPPSMGSSPPVEEGGLAAEPEPVPTVEPTPVPAPQQPTTAVSEPAPVVSVGDKVDVAAANAVGSVTGAQGEQTTEETAEQESDTAASEDAPAAANSNLLELAFNEQSWTEIFDANNQRVFVGLQMPDTTASVEGEPPFRLTIGNVTGVELRYQGETIDLVQRAGANNVARFTLGE